MKKIIITIIILLTFSYSIAQPPGNENENEDENEDEQGHSDDVPVDGGIITLFTAAGVYGYKKLKKNK